MRLISVSVGSIEPAAGKHVYNHASWDKAGFAKRSSLHFLRSICERQWFTALGSLIIHVKLANTNYPLLSVRKRSEVRHWQEERLGEFDISRLPIGKPSVLNRFSDFGTTPKSHPRILFFPFPKSNKYSISFSARWLRAGASIVCGYTHTSHVALVLARVLKTMWGRLKTRMILVGHFTTINEYTMRHPNRKSTRKKSSRF